MSTDDKMGAGETVYAVLTRVDGSKVVISERRGVIAHVRAIVRRAKQLFSRFYP